MKIKCDVYKSALKAQTYLYLKKGERVENLPEGLQLLLGELTHFLNLEIDESTHLALVKAQDVIAQLNDQGFFLQLPPAEKLSELAPATGFIQ